MKNKISNVVEKISGIHTECITLDEPFLEFAGRFAHLPGTVVLMSGGDLDCARYHMLAARPWLTFSGRGQEMRLAVDGHLSEFQADPFDTLRAVMDHLRMEGLQTDLPMAGGLFGYFSYDLKDRLEKLPRTSVDDLCLPEILLFAPSILVIQDKLDGKTTLCIPEFEAGDAGETLAFFNKTVAPEPPEKENFSGTGGFKSGFTKSAYMDAVGKIREYIAAGHVYQVNMSQRFEMGFKGDGYSLFSDLYKDNPAPFFAYVKSSDHEIVSTSPERFILRSGDRVETRPIKGTRPRGKTVTEDERLNADLRTSRKDDAELSMIVDLLRNDIGKVCTGGSVRVSEHKKVAVYKNVHHLVSVVEGVLDKKKDSVDLIKATFPGGSITGCPKVRSMEIIDELEPKRRHIYTGSMGYLSFHDTMDLSIAIRTATVLNDRILFSVGGGIVYDSDPEDEFHETLHKGRTLMKAFEGKNMEPESRDLVWMNGSIIPQEAVRIPLPDQGFQYGYGT
jgi:para-aminobenzoate synthetase component 1